jgi:hypothetical protein
MYGEYSYDIVPGVIPNDVVLLQMLDEFNLKPNGKARMRCNLLSDSFICEIQHSNDYETVHARLEALRTALGDQFNYTFSLRRKGDPIRIRGTHDAALAQQIVNG